MIKLFPQFWKLIISLVICYLVAGFASNMAFEAVLVWYPNLNLPTFNPPNSIFGPVWGVFYTMLGVIGYLIWRNQELPKREVNIALMLFVLHLVLNFLWTFLFFMQKNIWLAFWDCLILFIVTFIMIVNYYKVSKISSYMLIPYLMWIGFACVLTFAFWQLNH